MRSYRENPDTEENIKATNENEAYIRFLKWMEKHQFPQREEEENE